MDSRLKVAALTGNSVDPSSRFRVRQFVEPLRSHGIDIDDFPTSIGRHPPQRPMSRLAWFPRVLARSARNAYGSRDYDVALLQREMVSTLPTFEFLTARPRVLDVDDGIFLNQRLAAVDHIAKRSSLVLCGNQYLADHFSQICERVTVIPTAVDIGRYHLRDKRCDGPVTIGWIGTSSNLPGLEAIAPAIDRLLTSHRDVRFRLVSDLPHAWSLAGHPSVTAVCWSSEHEVAEIGHFDIGLMPLQDSEWNRYKCGYKLLTYMATGVVAVGSPVGINPKILNHEIVALPGTVDEWYESLVALVDSESLRKRLSVNGRARAVEHYSVDAIAPLLADALKAA